MHPLHLPGSFFVIIIIITFVLIHAPKVASSVDERYANCSRTFACGHIGNIGYPFWGSDRPDYCGCPGFQLNCRDSIPKIKIKSSTYHVLGINNESRLLNVARADYRDDLCPTFLINTTLNPDLFEFTADTQDINLYYYLPPLPPTLPPPPPPTSPTPPILPTPIQDQAELEKYFRHFTCNVTFCGYYPRNLSESADYIAKISGFLGSCVKRVILAANQSDVQSVAERPSPKGENLAKALAKGFGLQWNANNSLCDRCRGSGGQCGYNTVSNKFSCYCTDRPYDTVCPTPTATPTGTGKLNIKLSIGLAVPLTTTLAITFIVLLFRLKRKPLSSLKSPNFHLTRKNGERVEALILQYGSLAPKRFSYSNIKKITNSFKDKLGQGGYGSVYKGELPDSRIVAVKVLRKSKGDGQDFINEVASISRTSHVNIVTLLGFCYESSKRALIYEFMPNGSLDKFIHNQGSPENLQLSIRTLYEIARGIALGLEYLHRGCTTRILHFDIKPQNILLDANFCPKISDFGLAKLCETRDTIVSMTGARGTCGYIAPEVFCRSFGGVSYKSDVYSYGMMILDMVGGRRKNVNVEMSHSSEMYFPTWLYKQLEKSEKLNLDRIITDEEEEMTRKMIIVSLWCIQTFPSDRPSMSRVLEMLQGSLEDLPNPPNPMNSATAVRPTQNSSTTSSSSLIHITG